MAEKLTAEWCEERADTLRAETEGAVMWPESRLRAEMVEEALRLAARAIKAREWARDIARSPESRDGDRVPASYAEVERAYKNMATTLLAVLDGVEP